MWKINERLGHLEARGKGDQPGWGRNDKGDHIVLEALRGPGWSWVAILRGAGGRATMGYPGLTEARGEGLLLEDILRGAAAVGRGDILGGNVRSITCLVGHVVCEVI